MPIVIFHAPPSELPIVNIVQIAKPLSEKKKSFDSGALGDKLQKFFYPSKGFIQCQKYMSLLQTTDDFNGMVSLTV